MTALLRWSVPAAAVLLVLAGCGGGAGPKAGEVPTLAAGDRLAGEIAAGAPREYSVGLAAGDFFSAVVDQQGVDVAVALADPEGRTLLEVDSPNGRQGPEPLAAVAEAAGRYRLVVRPLAAGASGRYEVRVEALRPATARDRLEARARRSFAEGERLRAEGGEALPAYEDALAAWRELEADAEVAATLRRIGQEAFRRGDLIAAETAFDGSLALRRTAGERAEAGRLLNDLGSIYRRRGETERAFAAHREALGLARATGEPWVEGAALAQLGLVAERRGRFQEAIAAYREARDVWERLGDRAQEAAALGTLASAYAVVGEMDEAFDLLAQGLDLAREAGDRRVEADLELRLGWARYLVGDPAAALVEYERSLDLSGEGRDRFSEAAIHDRHGTALRALGRLDEAARAYGRALEIVTAAGSRSDEAHTRCNLADLDLERGEAAAAADGFARSRGLFQVVGDRQGEAAALVGSARAVRRLGDAAGARKRLDEAIGIIESVRGDLALGEMRASYLASFHDPYEELVDLLMALDRDQPGRGYLAQALEESERGRARTLLDSVAAAAAGEGRWGSGAPAGDRKPGWEPPAPVSVAVLQESLLDDDTRMLVYALGEARSFVWVVGRHLLVGKALASRRDLEELARRTAADLAQSRDAGAAAQAELAARALAREVLDPVAPWLGEGRLAVVADGGLLSVPFAVLPEPGGGEPLLVRHEVVSLPSASILALQRDRARGRAPPAGEVAVVADPVFAADDPRVGGSGGSAEAAAVAEAAPPAEWADLERSARDFGLERFPRLPFSTLEATSILSLAPPASRLRAVGFDASRETVLGGDLARYRIVHIASHGLLNTEHPELSGLVLSLVDRQGRPRDGFVRLGDLFRLDLPADLVVLSACRTALGRELRGEGLVGLTWGFFAAGAERVVVSYWNVNDRATAELMERFYQGMLKDGLPAAVALRQAQLALRAEPDHRPPYFWAGFTLAGDWR